MTKAKPKPRPHTAGIVAALTSIAGILASPAVLGVLPTKYAAAVTIAGVVLQAFTKGVASGGTDLVPKPGK
jgi:hypothetical protein